MAEPIPISWRCTTCGSESFQKLSLIHAGGVSSSTLSTTAVGAGLPVSGGGVAVGGGVASSRGVSVTALARSVAPPPMPVPPGGLGATIGLVGGFVGCGLNFRDDASAWWLALPGGAAIALWALQWLLEGGSYHRRLREQQAKREVWEKSYLCLRCGSAFAIE
jgi:DNA-directed RNA polymerase subunit RPC12/RpoP